MRTLIALPLFLLFASTSLPVAAERFAIEAELTPIATSSDGRFALDAEARYWPEATSADGRFALKATRVPEGGCEANPDPLFANGFENP